MNLVEQRKQLSEKVGRPEKWDGKRNCIVGVYQDLNVCNDKEIKMGETISACTQASARGIGKLA